MNGAPHTSPTRVLHLVASPGFPGHRPPSYAWFRNPRALDDWDDDWEQAARTAAAPPADWWDAVAHLPGVTQRKARRSGYGHSPRRGRGYTHCRNAAKREDS